MKTKYKHINFELENGEEWFIFFDHPKGFLGTLVWQKKLKCWEFQPCQGTGWSMDCLADIQDFAKQLGVPA
jgi:hypothetical protein